MFDYTIEGLKARDYPGGVIRLRSTESANPEFTRYSIDYPSDGLTITAMMNLPIGDGPFPVVVMLHGYYDRAGYWSGLGTWQEAEYLARSGYLTIAPDFRSWGASEIDVNFFATGLMTDTLNLISSLPSVSWANPAQVGIWGHSMGGGVATKALVVDPRIRAGILYAPNSADDADLIERWGPGCLPGQSEAAGDKCNPAEVIPTDFPQHIVDAYLNAAHDPAMLHQIAPIYHLDNVTAAIQIHIGTADGVLLVQTPPVWSENLFLALQAAGKEVEYHMYVGQGHFLDGQSWITMMQRTVDFFDTHLRG
jgi:dipeptidyl aminopeptidase/acylaminoacyl peptidase